MILYSAWVLKPAPYIYAVVAQSVEHFLGKEEVRQFKSAQQLQPEKDPFEGPFLVFGFKAGLNSPSVAVSENVR